MINPDKISPDKVPQPPFNDALYQALTPIKDRMAEWERMQNAINKHRTQQPSWKEKPSIQWQGDPNG